MKSLSLLISFSLLSFVSFAQLNPTALGVRLGGGNIGNNAEISFQKGLGDANRLELDLGLVNGRNISGFGLFGGYHWNFNIKESLNWFVGPGAGVSSINRSNGEDYTGVGIGGQLGIEYNFMNQDVPILLGFDLRPIWNLIGDGRSGFGYGGALSIRYIL